ncbi:FAD dependent oxidoreductase [Helicosporidium sp. ATCC 50920]|nr:FAD dependent oxidoreductase [Helicosporidium sp. ATCC 50920]|eukprot:KDD76040.1 FAD dependent oxidoreductase [Helicosporidium sp. ATCC 50920]
MIMKLRLCTALEAVAGGLRVALVEREDFAAGTSSRSTKLVHGGVRYLEKAVKQLDWGQFKLVFEALHERGALLRNVPYMATELPIMTPCYSWWEVPYYWAGMKLYDLVAGSQALHWSYYLPPSKSRAAFPTMSERRADGRRLRGTIVYYDGQFNDARLAVTLACTSALAGATVLNHAAAVSLLKDSQGRVCGAEVADTLQEENAEWARGWPRSPNARAKGTTKVYAKVVINATGPFADGVRSLSAPEGAPMIQPSSGVHVTLPDYYSPEGVGLIVPKTKDGRVVFMLPWLGHTIAGTTDAEAEASMRPQAREEEIQFILDSIAEYLTVRVRRSDVMSAWSGIRPLAVDPHAQDTAGVSRDHVVTVGPDNLVTVAGGKWTTYRLMAEDAIDTAILAGSADSKGANSTETMAQRAGRCATHDLRLIGASGWYPALFTEVAQTYRVPHRPGAIDTRVAQYLVRSYGDRAPEVTQIAEDRKLGHRVVQGYPILEAEVVYACRQEYCETPEDFIARRTRLAFLDKRATLQSLPKIVELMAQEKGWSSKRAKHELQRAADFVATFDSVEHPITEAQATA